MNSTDGRALLSQALSRSIDEMPGEAVCKVLTSVLNYVEGRSSEEPVWGALPWQFFREGLEIVPLSPTGQIDDVAALLRYRAGASVPYHVHLGIEHVLVLNGSQEDEHGRYSCGASTTNPAGTAHSVTSSEGCVVGIVWERPIEFP